MFFNVNVKYISTSNDASIVADFQTLHYDEEPILYTGRNVNGLPVVGSLMCENDDSDLFRHMLLLVSEQQLTDFITRKISYLQLVHNQDRVYLVDRTYNGESTKIYSVPVKAIPRDYLPLPSAFCPA